LFIDWNPKIILPTGVLSDSLKILSITNYKSRTLETIPQYRNLLGLCVYNGSVVSLSGLERFKNIRLYEHHYARNLQDISALSKLRSLTELELDHCKKIQDTNILEQCNELKILRYFDCPNLPSLSFLKKMKNLEFFSFSGINIEDGDVTPLLKLKYFGFYPNKKHYSHTCEELEKIHKREL
jgi:hypothetical protein